MDCIICRKERPGSEEHVIPLALGGSLVTYRVCKNCNDHLGAKIDGPLINHKIMAIPRDTFGLAGNSGHIPDALMVLTGRSPVLMGTDQRVAVERNPDGKYSVRLIFSRKETVKDDGSILIATKMDPRDAHKLPKVINATLRKHGRAPLVGEALEAVVVDALARVKTQSET